MRKKECSTSQILSPVWSGLPDELALAEVENLLTILEARVLHVLHTPSLGPFSGKKLPPRHQEMHRTRAAILWEM